MTIVKLQCVSSLRAAGGIGQCGFELRLTPVSDGDRCFIEWSAEFDCDPANEPDLVSGIGTNVFQGGFDALKRHFGGQ